MRRTRGALTTKRLDGRSAIAEPGPSPEGRSDGRIRRRPHPGAGTILKAAAQAWVILSSLDDWIARQPSLVTKKHTVLSAVVQRRQIAEGLARNFARRGLNRKACKVALAMVKRAVLEALRAAQE